MTTTRTTRDSLYYANDLPKGHVVRSEDLVVKRKRDGLIAPSILRITTTPAYSAPTNDGQG